MNLLLLAHADPSVRSLYEVELSKLSERPWRVIPFIASGSGLSARYDQLAHRLDEQASGGGPVERLLRYLKQAPREFVDHVVLATWSGGYPLALWAMPDPDLDGVIWLDSGHAEEPAPGVPDPERIAHAITFAKQAREGSKLFWMLHTDIDPVRYASTTEVARAIEHEAGGEGGLLHVERFPGARAQDHLEALRADGPPFVRRALEALIARDDTAPTPRDLSVAQAPPVILSPFREAIVDRARRRVGVRENPPGSNSGVGISEWISGCIRNGRRLGVRGVPWCAAFASWVVWSSADAEAVALHWDERASLRSIPAFQAHNWGFDLPIGYRAAVSELIADARATGSWRDVSENYASIAGDLICYGREGQDPRVGGMGHVAIDVGGGRAISGNLDDQVIEHDHDLSGRGLPIVGWIRVE
jgi:hypothetical protein